MHKNTYTPIAFQLALTSSEARSVPRNGSHSVALYFMTVTQVW